MTATFRPTGTRSTARRGGAGSDAAQQLGALRRGRVRRRSRRLAPSVPPSVPPSSTRPGLDLRVRTLWPDEGHVLDEVFDGMSPRSRYLRFHAPVRELSDRFRQRLLDVDGQDRVALVAELAELDGRWRPVGITRLARTGSAEAEVAIAVVDEMHRRGVARRLLTALGEQAARLDVTELHAQVLRENHAARTLFASVFTVAGAHVDADVVELTCLVRPVPAVGGSSGLGSGDEVVITPFDLFGDLYA